MKSTFFYDPDHDVKYGKLFPDPNHRKVILYYNYQDDEELETSGHGTHVAGIIAGKSIIDSASQYDVFHLYLK